MSLDNKTNGKLLINPSYLALVPRPSAEELQSLKNSLVRDGYHKEFPIIVNKNNEIIDGHCRYKLCTELSIPFIHVIKSFENEFDEKSFVISCAKNRRHLNQGQRALLSQTLLEIEAEKAKLRQLFGLKNQKININDPRCSEIGTTTGRTLEVVAKDVHVSKNTLYQAAIVNRESPKLAAQVLQGRMKLNKAFTIVRKEHEKNEIIKKLSDKSTTDNEYDDLQLIEGDFRTVSKCILDNSIDIIFTDPPYANEYVPLYEEIASLGTRVLKPGGSCLTYCSQRNLFKILSLMSLHLDYYWTICIKYFKQHSAMHDRKIFNEWKALAWFIKPNHCNKEREYITDFIQSEEPQKVIHPWQQSTKEASYYIEYLCPSNGTVLDMCMGTGTTGISAVKLGRKFIGIEIEKDTFELARARLCETINELRKGFDKKQSQG